MMIKNFISLINCQLSIYSPAFYYEPDKCYLRRNCQFYFSFEINQIVNKYFA